MYKHLDFDTLLALEPVEPILPLHMLVENGYTIHWTGQELVASHHAGRAGGRAGDDGGVLK